jgi:hypothetical protein
VSDETLLKTFLIPALLFGTWICFAFYGFIKKVFRGYKFKKKDIRAILKAICVLLLYCLAIWVFLIFGTLFLGYLFGVNV